MIAFHGTYNMMSYAKMYQVKSVYYVESSHICQEHVYHRIKKAVQPVLTMQVQQNIPKLQKAQSYAAIIVSWNFDYVNDGSLDFDHAI